ncbi:MAG TPA: MFS transporter [Methylovirgula sp.]|nr:MFS transporter [Methylovirgula sp.]
MFLALLRTRRFAPLFWCQFLSAFNDNFVRNMLAMLLLFRLGGSEAGMLITLAIGIFILPSLFLSALGGEIADARDKASVARSLKFAEIFVQMIAAAGLWLASLPLLYAGLFGLGVIATLFGPVKYGLLPDHLKRHELVAGNALVETATFLAILFGLVAGALAAGRNVAPQVITLQLMGIALACFVTSCFIPPTGVAASHVRIRANILASSFVLLRELRGTPFLWRAGLALSWFWLTGAVAISLMPVAVRHATSGGIEVEAAISGLFAVGIGTGSLAAARIAGGRIRLEPVPLAALGMAFFLVALGFATSGFAAHVNGKPADQTLASFLTSPRGLFISFDIVGLAAAGGLFTVPLFAAVQALSPSDRRARTIAGVNILNALYIVAGTLLTAVLQSRLFGFSEPLLLAGLGICNLGAAAYVQKAILPLPQSTDV